MRKYTETVNNSKAITDNYTVKKEKISGITVYMYIPKEKKEKDMKETNLQHYKNQLKTIFNEHYKDPITIIKEFKANTGVKIPCYGFESCTDAILNWMSQPYEEKILNDKERRYLANVIEPFRSRVKYIKIEKVGNGTKRFVHIKLLDDDSMNFPDFKVNTMYKGMEPDKPYTLEKLGL